MDMCGLPVCRSVRITVATLTGGRAIRFGQGGAGGIGVPVCGERFESELELPVVSRFLGPPSPSPHDAVKSQW